MAKRSHDDSDVDESSNHAPDENKRFKVSFESIRLPAVSNVNDIKNRTAVYQVAKLSQQIKYLNKKKAEIERDNVRLKRRQETDENNYYLIHRQMCEMYSIVACAIRSESDVDVKVEIEDEQFPKLSELVQLGSDQAEKEYEKSIKRSANLAQELGRFRIKRAEKYNTLSRKLIEFMEEQSPSTSDSALKELAESYKTVSEENARLVTENNRLQQDASTARLKLRQKEDECEMLYAKNEELTRDLEDAQFEADKNLRMANKFEHRLGKIAQEMKSNDYTNPIISSKKSSLNGQVSNGSPLASCDPNKEIESIQKERDDFMELANKRLQEIQEINTKLSKSVAEISRLKSLESHVSSDSIMGSDEYKTLKHYYSVAVKEYDRVSKELEDVTTERDRIRQAWAKKIESIRTEYEENSRKLMLSAEKAHEDNALLRNDYDILRTEFDQTLAQNNTQTNEARQSDIRSIINSINIQNHVLKQEVGKYKKKFKDALNMAATEKREKESLQKKVDASYLIQIEEVDGELMSPDVHENPAAEVNRLKKENEALRAEVKLLGLADRAERMKFFEKELQTHMSAKLNELEKLKKDNERLENLEKALSDELESIGQALEELQDQNCTLITSKTESEDNVLRLMNDRIVTTQILNKLKEKVSNLEDQLKKSEQKYKVLDFELQTLNTASLKNVETLETKTMENSRLSTCIESHRKTIQELGLSRDNLKIRMQKLESQLKHTQEILGTKSSQVEVAHNKCRRLEEELNTIRRKYDRVQKTEKYGSTDAVLVEEVRQLKEVLTCPSCKVNKKDTILLKCYHFFCESCIKARYDTRQRKCPKCNCGFGANDFHRAYLG